MSVPYCEVAAVREKLPGVPDTEAVNTELAGCISDADVQLRSWAKAKGLTIPTDPVPEDIAKASKYYAVWLFRVSGDPPVNNQDVYDLAKQFFDSWASGANENYIGSA
jgi:hypothetical protein